MQSFSDIERLTLSPAHLEISFLAVIAKGGCVNSRNCSKKVSKQVKKQISGNLGIGTTSPSAKLEVVGNINATGNVKLSSTGYIHSGGNVIIRLGTA